jgi:hypothetical protein
MSPSREVQESAGDIRVGGRGKPDCRLVIGRAAAGTEHDAGIGQRQDDRVAVTDAVGAEHRLIEVPGSVLVGDHQELRDEKLAGSGVVSFIICLLKRRTAGLSLTAARPAA